MRCCFRIQLICPKCSRLLMKTDNGRRFCRNCVCYVKPGGLSREYDNGHVTLNGCYTSKANK